MRIITGRFRGKNIHVPRHLDLRPTTDYAKTGLFNILTSHFGTEGFEELSVLDLFAGTGNISYEFISRGAQRILAVDQNADAVKFINSMFRQLHAEGARAIRSDVFRFLAGGMGKFDLIFADPPFALEGIEGIPAAVFERDLLNPGGWLVLEHESSLGFSNHPAFREKRDYGKVAFSIYEAAHLC